MTIGERLLQKSGFSYHCCTDYCLPTLDNELLGTQLLRRAQECRESRAGELENKREMWPREGDLKRGSSCGGRFAMRGWDAPGYFVICQRHSGITFPERALVFLIFEPES